MACHVGREPRRLVQHADAAGGGVHPVQPLGHRVEREALDVAKPREEGLSSRRGAIKARVLCAHDGGHDGRCIQWQHGGPVAARITNKDESQAID